MGDKTLESLIKSKERWKLISPIIMIFVIGYFISLQEEIKKPDTIPVEVVETQEEGKENTTNIQPKQEESKETTSQRNAIRTAENYLKIKGFSRTGLIDQLKFEDFSEEDAVYAVDNISIDYNDQAKKSAESYMDIKGFSKGGLIEQLKFEGFTQAQAEYGATTVGL
jgi:hypothetical protein